MPLGLRPMCKTCKTQTSTMWRKSLQGDVLCNSCALKAGVPGTRNGRETPPELSEKAAKQTNGNGNGHSGVSVTGVRKSARLKPSRHRQQTSTKSLATKGKSRRVIFKKNPVKSAASVATVMTSDYVFHKGQYWQVGDIVSLMDEDGSIYYAQIRGLLQDQYCQKSAVITWLLPTLSSPKDRFDPSTYILGPEEDLPRTLEVMEFICHAPSEYFRARTSPYPTVPLAPELGYIWTSVGHEITPVPTIDEIFGTKQEQKHEKSKEKEHKRKGSNTSNSATATATS